MKRCGKCGTQYADSAQFCLQDGLALVADDPEMGDSYLGQVILGQFVVEALIGEGGMATIYRARQKGIDRPVAIKILRTEVSSLPGLVERLHREARLASRLLSPHVAHVYLTGELPNGRHVLAMEHLEGRELARVIDETGALPEERVIHILRQLGEALAEAHELGIVHRDLKPDNIMLVRRGADDDFVKVLDFGIAKQIGPDSASLTGVGLAVGTPLYMSPEAATGMDVTPAGDVYSIGILAYEMLAGQLPFVGDTPGAVLMQQVHEQPPPLAQKMGRRKASPALVALVHRCLAKVPAHRPADGRAFLAALEAALREEAPMLAGTPAESVAPAGTAMTATPRAEGLTSEGAAAHGTGTATTAAPAQVAAPASGPPNLEPKVTVSIPAAPPNASRGDRMLVLEHTLAELEKLASQGDGAGGPLDDPSAPAFRRRRGNARTWMAVAVLAALGIGAMTLSNRAGRSVEGGHDVEMREAERARAEGRLDGPNGAIALTDQVLKSQDDARARVLRHEIATDLQEAALRAEHEGKLDEALANSRLLERLAPTPQAHARVEGLEARLGAARHQKRPAGRRGAAGPLDGADEADDANDADVTALYLQPSNVVTGAPVSIVARTAGPLAAGRPAIFEIRAPNGSPLQLPATQPSPDRYTTTHTFETPGPYEIGFSGSWAQVTVRDRIDDPNISE